VDKILKPGCYRELLVDFKVGGACTQLAVSKLLSYAIIAGLFYFKMLFYLLGICFLLRIGALLLKVPQIKKMTDSKSAAGISVLSLIFELLGYVCVVLCCVVFFFFFFYAFSCDIDFC
jgi:hypothetical protein